MVDFSKKYIKYKLKYIKLIGGTVSCDRIPFNGENLDDKYKVLFNNLGRFYKSSNCDNFQLYDIRKDLLELCLTLSISDPHFELDFFDDLTIYGKSSIKDIHEYFTKKMDDICNSDTNSNSDCTSEYGSASGSNAQLSYRHHSSSNSSNSSFYLNRITELCVQIRNFIEKLLVIIGCSYNNDHKIEKNMSSR